MTYYYAGLYTAKVEPVEIDSVTEKTVVLSDTGRRTTKITNWCGYYPTREQAVQSVACRLRLDVEAAFNEWQRVKNRWEAFQQKENA